MKKLEPSQEPSVRLPFLVALGVMTFLVICVIVALSPRRPAAAGGISVEAQSPAAQTVQSAGALAHSTRLGAGIKKQSTKPEVVRADNSPLSDVQLSFKLDPRLTRGLYMGDRWVSPPTYIRVGEGPACTLEVKVQGVDVQGRPIAISPEWRVEDADMLVVSAGEGKAVNITVLHGGQTSVEVASLGLSKKLVINASERDGTLVVELAQPSGGRELLLANSGPAYGGLGGQGNSPSPSAQPAQHRRHRPQQVVEIPEALRDMQAQFEAFRQSVDPTPQSIGGMEAAAP